MSSKLIALYKATQDFNNLTGDNEGLEFRFKEKTFMELAQEAKALGPVFGVQDNLDKLDLIEFNTPGGPLKIYKI